MPSDLEKQIQAARLKVLGEMPDVKPVDVSPTSGLLDTLLGMRKTTQAITNPFTGNVHYNPAALTGATPDEIEQMLAHEFTHSRQAQTTPWYKTAYNAFMPQGPYAQRPYEMDAFQTEKDRASRLGLSMPDPVTGAMDIALPSPNLRKKMKVQQ